MKKEAFGDRLRQLRGKTLQKTIADSLGIPQATWSNYERNRNRPDFDMLCKICSHFAVTSDWLLFGCPEQPSGISESARACMGEGNCRKCNLGSQLEKIIKTEHEDLRNLSAELRNLYRQLVQLEHENGDLRTKVALLEAQLKAKN